MEKTCSRYLLSQQALLSKDEYRVTEAAVADFRTVTGPPLQAKLKAWDKNNKHTNYVSEPWFDMYLKDRASVVLNYNPFLAFKFPEPPMNDPLLRATNMLVSSARFLRTFRAGLLEPEVYHLDPAKSNTPFYRRAVGLAPQMLASFVSYAFKAFPLDMSQYSRLLNSTRVPQVGRDVLSSDDTARHVLVMRNGNFYVFDILDENGSFKRQGFDRHLFGLRNLALQAGGELPALYRDPAYAKINHNVISTSTLPSNNISFGGFAPVVKDGFGVGYQMQEEMVGVVMSSYPPHRDGAAFIDCLGKAYGIIGDVLTAA
ncbi:hypothetical protein HAZT_HAZT010761 [Hyalella azteca]|uniref:Choline/carnitine acyltransferase domain-containing protein n=1 Tax=Hyalella azteca TaxID=294128 RepID=A0A6A0H405_HYAAZ|nr:hypothetical protein HAZT_HAZT010761 [Hyalella azteca]